MRVITSRCHWEGSLALWLVSLALAAAGCCGQVMAAPAGPLGPSYQGTNAPFERKYEGRGLLVPEEQQVVALANKAGITNIESITFYNIHPSADWGVTVKEADTIEGRTATFRRVYVKVVPRATNRWDAPASGPERAFQIERVRSEKSILLRVGEKYHRVQITSDGLDLQKAEQILAAFVTGTWSPRAPSPAELKTGLQAAVDFEGSCSMGRRKGKESYWVALPARRSRLERYLLGFEVDNDGRVLLVRFDVLVS